MYRPWLTTFAPIFADILKPFEVRSNTIRVGESISKGYRRNDIERAAALYLATSPVTTLQPPENRQKWAMSPVTNGIDVTAGKTLNPADSLTCNVVTAETPESGVKYENGVDVVGADTPSKNDPVPDEPPLAGEVEWTG